jgi:ketosteroid isomerase-like protein
VKFTHCKIGIKSFLKNEMLCTAINATFISTKSHRMRNWIALSLVLTAFTACTNNDKKEVAVLPSFKPDSPELQREIEMQDSIFFAAYNVCDLEKQGTIYSDSIEFYHDQGGVMTSKQGILDGTKKNICGKVTRELIKGSIEVYPIKGYGAVEMGLHQFHNNQEKNDKPHPSKFTLLWQKTASGWKIARVISLH